MSRVVPTRSSAIAEVRMAAAVSVRLRRKLAHISRNAYAIRAIIRTLLAPGRARLLRDPIELLADASHSPRDGHVLP